MADDNQGIVKQTENKAPTGGFNVHPENINRNGRPKKGLALTDLMRQIFEENESIPKSIVAKLLQMAASGDIAAIREVLDRIEGKPIQPNAEITEDKMGELLHIYKPEKLHNEPAK
jgi:hypothetical protein